MSKYVKAIVAVVGAVAIVVQAALTDGSVNADEVGQIVTAFLVAVGVYFFPNKDV